jgi:hypothetical protein
VGVGTERPYGACQLFAGQALTPRHPPSHPQLTGGGVNDVASSPDGKLLAAACRDGAMRLIELSSGAVVGGFCSYYGALLCCAFSPDGKYVATGEIGATRVSSLAKAKAKAKAAATCLHCALGETRVRGLKRQQGTCSARAA